MKPIWRHNSIVRDRDVTGLTKALADVCGGRVLCSSRIGTAETQVVTTARIIGTQGARFTGFYLTMPVIPGRASRYREPTETGWL